MKTLAIKFYRYLKVYFNLAKLSLDSILVFRINGLFFGLAPIVWFATVLIFLATVFSRIKSLGGWNLWEMVFLTAVGELLFHLYWGTILNNLRQFVDDVRVGKIDQLFLKPINQRFLVSFRSLDFTILGSLLNTFFVFGFALSKVIREVASIRIAGFVFLFVSAYLICYFVYFIFASLAFWVVNARPFLDWVFELSDFGHYPAEIYPLGLRAFFTFFLPILFFGYVPSAFLLGKIDWEYLPLAASIVLLLYAISRLVWAAGLRRYQSASS